MSKTRTRTVGLSLMLAGAVLLAAPACKKKEANAEGSQAQAVEADNNKESDEQAQKGDESDKGAAAKKGDEAKDKKKAEAPETATIGKPAPDFTLTDATGEKHTLSDYRGKTVVLEWTNPECPYVQRHYKEETMSKTLEKLGGSDKVAWLAIDTTHTNTPKKSKKWKDKHGIEKPILQDKEGKVGKRYEAKTTPHMYVIDKEGVLRYRGAIDDDPKGDKKPKARTNYVTQAVQALQNGESLDKKKTEAYGCSVKYGG